MKILRVDIQDGESQYSEWFKAETQEQAEDLAGQIADGFLRAKRNQEITEATIEEIKILEKFGVF